MVDVPLSEKDEEFLLREKKRLFTRVKRAVRNIVYNTLIELKYGR